MHLPVRVAPFCLAVCMAVAIPSSNASAQGCLSGQTGPATGESNFFTPPNDEYCTFVDLGACSQSVRAHWLLFWPQACVIPVQAYFRAAILISPGCYQPGAQVGPTYTYSLVGSPSANVDHVSPIMANPGLGPGFICINMLTTGNCPVASPMTTPRIRFDGSCESCKSYNSFPGSGGQLELCSTLSGNPVMWVEPVGGVDVGETPAARLALAGARPNPALRAVNVWFTLSSGEPATLDLYDTAGRRVARRQVGMLGAGEHMVTLEGAAGLRAGLYFLRLTQEGHVLHSRVAVAR